MPQDASLRQQEGLLSERPCIISTLEYGPVVQDGAARIVCDRATMRYFSFRSRVVTAIERMDGAHSVEAIAEECGLTTNAVRTLLDRLAALQLLAGPPPNAILGAGTATNRTTTVAESIPSERARQPGGLRTAGLRTARVWRPNLLTIHIDLIRGDAWLGWLYKALRLRFVFTAAGGILLVGLWLLAAVIWALYRFRFETIVLSLVGVPGLALVVIVTLGMGVLHELAHGLACKHFGGTVRSMGIGIYYFSPVFYTDVSDAWMFPRRSQRLITHAAGIGMNLVLASLAALLLLTVSPISWFAQIFCVVFFVGVINSVFNLNPLLRLDGYFLLTDLIGVSNLRTNAFAYIVSGIAWVSSVVRIPRIERASSVTRVRPRTVRERWLLIAYGGCALVYMVILLRVMVLGVGQFLAQHFGLVGWFIALVGALAILGGSQWVTIFTAITRKFPQRLLGRLRVE